MKNRLNCWATKVTIWLYNLYTPQKEKNQFSYEMWKRTGGQSPINPLCDKALSHRTQTLFLLLANHIQ
jgi:hypothetical protein